MRNRRSPAATLIWLSTWLWAAVLVGLLVLYSFANGYNKGLEWGLVDSSTQANTAACSRLAVEINKARNQERDLVASGHSTAAIQTALFTAENNEYQACTGVVNAATQASFPLGPPTVSVAAKARLVSPILLSGLPRPHPTPSPSPSPDPHRS